MQPDKNKNFFKNKTCKLITDNIINLKFVN